MEVVYVIRMDGTDYYKIGYTSRDISDRLAELQTGNPRRLSVVSTIEGDEAQEERLHRLFAHCQTEVRNEWFHLSGKQIEEITNGVQHIPHQSSGIRGTPDAFRPICGRQQYPATTRRKDVPYGSRAIDRESVIC